MKRINPIMLVGIVLVFVF